jgi:alkylation response protein AidB-like acyl-CoA dehydrogenase
MSLEGIFTLPGEYNELRSSLRALSEKEIAPFAQAVDADHRYPQEAHDALVKAGLFEHMCQQSLVAMALMRLLLV